MNLRSLLFVPGDSEKKLGKGGDSGADALILDLEDSVAPARKPLAREMVRDYLAAHAGASRPSQLWVRINPLDEGGIDDLAAVVRAAPDGVMIPKTDGPEDIVRLGHYLDGPVARSNDRRKRPRHRLGDRGSGETDPGDVGKHRPGCVQTPPQIEEHQFVAANRSI